MTAEYPQGDWRWEPVTDELLDGLPPAPFRLTLQQAALVSAPAECAQGTHPKRDPRFALHRPWATSRTTRPACLASQIALFTAVICDAPLAAISIGQDAPDRSASGSSTCRDVPAPAGLWTVMVPPRAATRSRSPTRPEPRTGSAPPTPSSRTRR